MPDAFLNTARAASTLTGFSNSALTAMEWERYTGTRTQVTLARKFGWCMILRPSFSIFISSLV